jgi:hypothetical protein
VGYTNYRAAAPAQLAPLLEAWRYRPRSEDPASRSCFVHRHTNRRTEQHSGDALDPDLSGGHRAAKAKRGVHPSPQAKAARCPHLTAAWA